MSKFVPLFNSSVNDSVTVGPSSTTIIPTVSTNRERYRVIRNTSDSTTIWVSVHVAAEVNKGIQLKPGEYWELHANNMTHSAINGITVSGTADVATCIGIL